MMTTLLSALLALQFTASTTRPPGTQLEGYWQSCQDAEGVYGEAVYEMRPLHGGEGLELHLGPKHEFSLFKGLVEEERDHNAPENLFVPHTVTVENGYGHGHWAVLDLIFDVLLAGASRPECEGFWIVLKSAAAQGGK